MTVPFVDLSFQEDAIKEARERRFADIISRSAFIGSAEVAAFEDRFAEYCGTAHCISVGNGTDALMLLFVALGIGSGDEVIVMPTTFIASVSPLVHLGARPVFVDIDAHTRGMDLALVEDAITSRTKAILAVDLYGDVPDMDALRAIADRHGLLLLEDACQAHGARYKGARAGSFGHAAAFSFYPGKNLGAYGDGGAITTDDEALAGKLRMLRNHGGVRKYEHVLPGFNSRLDTLQAAVLTEKLVHLDEWNDMRRTIAGIYRDELGESSFLALPPVYPHTEPVFHLYVVEVDASARDGLIAHLHERGIGAGIHYPQPLHLVPAFASLGYQAGDFPHAEAFAARVVSLPMYPGMTAAQAAEVVDAVRDFNND
jgi:dTDP-4-amino-4,6-dideoxygalactose transaminase